MIDWSARAKAQLAQPPMSSTCETDETRVVSVSSVSGEPDAAPGSSFSSVSSVGGSALLANVVSNVGATGMQRRSSGNPYLSPEQGDKCHDQGWSDEEIETFLARAKQFETIGRLDAEHLAELLTLRDREGDERRFCLECKWLGASGRCFAEEIDRKPGPGSRLEPEPTILRWCPAFEPRTGLKLAIQAGFHCQR